MMKTQQMRQEEAERFLRYNKALKTTVYVVFVSRPWLFQLQFQCSSQRYGEKKSQPLPFNGPARLLF